MIIDNDNIPRYTYDEYKLWDKDWELIEGYPYWLKPSGFRHSIVKGNALTQLFYCLKNDCQQSKCKVIMSLDWIVSNNTIVRPDVLIVSEETRTDYLEFPPVLIIEIVTFYTSIKDRQVKFEIYQEQGVKYYLLANCETQSVTVFELIDTLYQEVNKNTFELSDNCEMSLDFHQFWEKINVEVSLN